ncbi:DUF2236 domain-containing protein [Pseudonocardiaceae bacterium YIM PH 21723]|nr:DUF2236 domain-containing protein [Pseudonocardiaceae bacterium YIM PH 21723]
MTALPEQFTEPTLDEAPPEIWEVVSAAAALAGPANVIMQLSALPIGHGVALSTVDSGRLDYHPIKRARTTLGYIAVALFGTDEERRWMRSEVDGQHRQVRNKPGAEVKYNAFSRDLQLWVAACIYQGFSDVLAYRREPLTEDRKDAIYRYSSRIATTLQVPPEMWPADRAAFQVYWDRTLPTMAVDELTRDYLRNHMVDLRFLPVAGWLMRPFGRFVTTGFLPPSFRDLLGLDWDDRRQRRFERLFRIIYRTTMILPEPLRRFPGNAYLRDFKRRRSTGRPFV